MPGIDLSREYLFYYLELIVFALALAFGLFVVRTPLGRRMRAMRDDALAAGAVGAEVPVLRMTAFVLASVYGGVAGVLYAGLIRYVAPETFSIANMFLLLAMVIIGGRQSLVGCVVGAVGAVPAARTAGRLSDVRPDRLRLGRRADGGVRADRPGRAAAPDLRPAVWVHGGAAATPSRSGPNCNPSSRTSGSRSTPGRMMASRLAPSRCWWSRRSASGSGVSRPSTTSR